MAPRGIALDVANSRPERVLIPMAYKKVEHANENGSHVTSELRSGGRAGGALQVCTVGARSPT